MLENPSVGKLTQDEVQYRLGVLGLVPNEVRILCVLWKYPGLSVPQLCQLAGVNRTECYAYVERLAGIGLINVKAFKQRGKNCYAYSAKEVIEKLIAKFNLSFERTLALAEGIEQYAKEVDYNNISEYMRLEIKPVEPILC